MTKKQRQQRVIARGETSNHCHVIIGDVEVKEENGQKIITVNEDSNAVLKHLLEKEYLELGKEIWTKEHKDISLPPGTYRYVAQQEYNPYNQLIQRVED